MGIAGRWGRRVLYHRAQAQGVENQRRGRRDLGWFIPENQYIDKRQRQQNQRDCQRIPQIAEQRSPAAAIVEQAGHHWRDANQFRRILRFFRSQRPPALLYLWQMC